MSHHAKCDVIIVGGGIHGVAAAYFLAKKGLSVVLLEKEFCGRCASGVNAGGVRTLGRVLPEIPLSLASSTLWQTLDFLHGFDGAFVRTGQIKVAESEQDMQILHERRDLLAQHGFDHEKLIDRDQVRQIVPAIAEHVQGALWVSTDGFAFPYLIVQAFARQARKHGAQIHEQSPVNAIENSGNHWRVRTPEHTITGEKLLLCAGAWTAELARLCGDDIPVTPGGLMLMVTQRVPHFINPVLGATSRGLSFKQFGNGTVVIGGALECEADARQNHAELEFSRLANSARIVTDLFPFLKNVSITRAWSGIDGYAPDHTSIIGPSASVDNLYYACGFSSSGFQLGPASGQYLAELIADNAANPLHRGLLPARFSA
ncbi:NAD(P)/FAD-dependent oxidoreductase [Advenella incenata]